MSERERERERKREREREREGGRECACTVVDTILCIHTSIIYTVLL